MGAGCRRTCHRPSVSGVSVADQHIQYGGRSVQFEEYLIFFCTEKKIGIVARTFFLQ